MSLIYTILRSRESYFKLLKRLIYQFFIKSIEMKVYETSRSFSIISTIIHPFLWICQPQRQVESYLRISDSLRYLWPLPGYMSDGSVSAGANFCIIILGMKLPIYASLYFPFHWLPCGPGSDPDTDTTVNDGGATRWKEPRSLNDCHEQTLPQKPKLLAFGLLCEKAITSFLESLYL